MKILWVKPGKLLPLDTGGKLRTYNILRQLHRTHDLTYLSYYGGHRDRAYETEITGHLPGTVCIYTAVPDVTPFERYLDYLRRLYWRAPYAVSKFTAPEVQRTLTPWIQARRFDVAVCDFLSSALNFPAFLATPTVLFQHNVETVLWERKARLEANWLDRLVSKIEYAKMVRFEPQQVRRFHHVIAVSEQDRQAMGWMCDPAHISVVPTGVDLAKYQYDPTLRAPAPLVVFTGSMDWEANIDGVEYFCRDIWPRVLAQFPEARFRVVGRDPHPRVTRLASPSVEITGSVPSIVDHLREAAVVVVPLRIGGGTRIKIYEGMAMGKATVSTTVGAEGLDVQHERDILLADDPDHFANAIVNLLRDENLRRRYEGAAAMTARKYDWSVITQRFVEVLEKVLHPGSPSAADAPAPVLTA
ncbi:MAG: glycosyltransferase [Acidobacteriales bacterium]|nr:glycosyltransferase [Terriglobales bacterium]